MKKSLWIFVWIPIALIIDFGKIYIGYGSVSSFCLIIISGIVIFKIMNHSEEDPIEDIEEKVKDDSGIKITLKKVGHEKRQDVDVILRNESAAGYSYKCPYCDAEISESIRICPVCRNDL